MPFVDLLIDLGVEIARPNIKRKLDENQLRKRLNDYLSRQQKLNDICSVEEEIDFEGVVKYIQAELINDVRTRLSSGDSIQRKEARNRITTKAIHYAQADTKMARKRVSSIIDTLLDILKAFYRSKVNQDLLFISAEIIDTVEREGELTRQELGTLKDEIDKISEASILSLDRNAVLASTGRVDEVQEHLSTFINGIRKQHILAPYYEFDVRDHGQIVSAPVREDATDLFPPAFRIVADKMILGDREITDWDSATLWESYRRQEPIEAHVLSAQKFLGDVLDPVQIEADELTGTTIVFVPKQFPEAEPCSLAIDGDVVIDYMLMRTKEVLEDGTAVWTNDEEPNRIIGIECLISPSLKQFSFNLNTSQKSPSALLQYYKTVERISRGGVIEIRMLSKRLTVIQGPIANRASEKYNQAVDFYSKLCAIESFFSVTFDIPEKITQADEEIANYLYSLAKDGSARKQWGKMESSMSLSEGNKELIEKMEADPLTLICSIDVTIDYFGAHFAFPIQRRFVSAVVDNLDKLKRKAEVLDEEDSITIRFIPYPIGESGEIIDYYNAGNDPPNTILLARKLDSENKQTI